jgi:hypothetical protein
LAVPSSLSILIPGTILNFSDLKKEFSTQKSDTPESLGLMNLCKFLSFFSLLLAL